LRASYVVFLSVPASMYVHIVLLSPADISPISISSIYPFASLTEHSLIHRISGIRQILVYCALSRIHPVLISSSEYKCEILTPNAIQCPLAYSSRRTYDRNAVDVRSRLHNKIASKRGLARSPAKDIARIIQLSLCGPLFVCVDPHALTIKSRSFGNARP